MGSRRKELGTFDVVTPLHQEVSIIIENEEPGVRERRDQVVKW